jgi:hypothetical protein
MLGYAPGLGPPPPAQPVQQPQQPAGATITRIPQPQQPVTTTYKPGVLSTPGIGEQWYTNHASQYNNPSQLGQYWQGLQGRTNGAGVQPTNSQAAWGQVQSTFQRPAQGAQNAWDASEKLYRQPTQGEGYLNSAAGYFQGPNRTNDYANSLGYQMFMAPGQAETYTDYSRPMLQGMGQGQQMAYNSLGQFQQPGAAETNNQNVQGLLAGNNASADFNQKLTSSGFLGKNTVGDEYGYFAPGLREKSYSENLYESGDQGLNTFYDREAQKRTRALSDQMAAMGVFGSGATARSLSEMQADLGASQAKDMAGLAAQADQARLGRTAAADTFAKDTSGEELNRYGLGMQAANQADESMRGNVGLMNQASQSAQQLQIQRLFQGGQLGLQSDAEGRARIELGGNLANNAQQAAMNRAKTGADVQSLADHSRFDQGQGLANTGNMLGTQYLNRMQQSVNSGIQGDQEQRARANDYFARAGDLDQRGLDSETFNRDTAGGVDLSNRAGLLAGQNAATGAQNAFEQRERYGIQDKQKLAESMSGLVSSALGKSADEQAAIYESIVQSLIAQGGIDRASAEQQAQAMFQAQGIAIQGVGAAAAANSAKK